MDESHSIIYSWEFLGIDRVRKLSYPSIGEGIYLGRNDAHVPRYEVIIKVSSGLGRFSNYYGEQVEITVPRRLCW